MGITVGEIPQVGPVTGRTRARDLGQPQAGFRRSLLGCFPAQQVIAVRQARRRMLLITKDNPDKVVIGRRLDGHPPPERCIDRPVLADKERRTPVEILDAAGSGSVDRPIAEQTAGEAVVHFRPGGQVNQCGQLDLGSAVRILWQQRHDRIVAATEHVIFTQMCQDIVGLVAGRITDERLGDIEYDRRHGVPHSPIGSLIEHLSREQLPRLERLRCLPAAAHWRFCGTSSMFAGSVAVVGSSSQPCFVGPTAPRADTSRHGNTAAV